MNECRLMKINVWPQSNRVPIRCFDWLVASIRCINSLYLYSVFIAVVSSVYSICYSVRCIIIQKQSYKTKHMYSLYLWCL